MKTLLYRTYHSQKALEVFSNSYANDNLIIFIPPHLQDFSFVNFLPAGPVILQEEESAPKEVERQNQESIAYPKIPICGVLTSGSTGQSKLVLYSKENLQASIKAIYSLFDKNKVEQVFCYPQPFHTFGLCLGYAMSMIENIPVIIPEGKYSKKHHQHWIDKHKEHQLTLGTPTHFIDLNTWLEGQSLKVPKSYSCIMGGAVVSQKLWKQAQNELNIQHPSIGYGATEASPGISHLPPGFEPQSDGEIGFPLPHVKTRFTEQGYYFSGPNLCLAIIENGKIEFPKEYFMPDRIQVQEYDNRWVFEGRSQWILNRGGEKFLLEEIEKWIYNSFQLQVLCTTVPDNRLGQELGILLKKHIPLGPDIKKEIYRFLQIKTQRQFNSDYFHIVDQLPLNENQKLDRIAARNFLI